jgi:uncharacterized protein (DUF1501 family)
MNDRRDFLKLGGRVGLLGALGLPGMPPAAWAAAGVKGPAGSAADRILVLVELKGGNDGLNTIVPYADPLYRQLRPKLALADEDLLRIDPTMAWHKSLEPLMPMWNQREMTILHGLGYPQPNLSHFRSIEIWDTGSPARDYYDEGWVARAMDAGLRKAGHFTAEGVAVGSASLGALDGTQAVTLSNTRAFLEDAKLVRPATARGNAALEHLLRVEAGVVQAAEGLRNPNATPLATEFPKTPFGNSVRATCEIIAGQKGKGGVPVFHVSLGSFDTHQNQLARHATLLKQLSEGLVALRSGLVEAGVWDRTLVLTYAEFGRRPAENRSAGTDHGTAAPHFAFGGAVRGGVIGRMPSLERLDASRNLIHGADFRQVYATIARRWWGVDADNVLRGRFDDLPFLAG